MGKRTQIVMHREQVEPNVEQSTIRDADYIRNLKGSNLEK